MARQSSINGTGIHQRVTAPTLEALIEQTQRDDLIHKRDLRSGDWVLIATKNSFYTICVLGNDLYSVSGGWFDREGISPLQTTINGCTWGGSAIKHDIVAGRGLFLEFGNQILTTRIREVRVIRSPEQTRN